MKKKLKFTLVETVDEVLAAALEVKRQARPTPRIAKNREPRFKKFNQKRHRRVEQHQAEETQ